VRDIHRSTRSHVRRGFTLLELLLVVAILGLVVGLAAGTASSLSAIRSHRLAVQTTKQALLRARLLAENGGGATLRQEGTLLIAEAVDDELPTIRMRLPRGWSVERADSFGYFEGLARFGPDGCAFNATYFITDPDGNQTEIDYLGVTGQTIVHARFEE
jgi:prepilin-type N-terminal cleavage/methylation domain-containing protein